MLNVSINVFQRVGMMQYYNSLSEFWSQGGNRLPPVTTEFLSQGGYRIQVVTRVLDSELFLLITCYHNLRPRLVIGYHWVPKIKSFLGTGRLP